MPATKGIAALGDFSDYQRGRGESLPAAASVRIVTFPAPSYNPPRAANRRYKRCVTKQAAMVATVARVQSGKKLRSDRRATRRSDRFGILGGTRPTVTRGRRRE